MTLTQIQDMDREQLCDLLRHHADDSVRELVVRFEALQDRMEDVEGGYNTGYNEGYAEGVAETELAK